MTPQEIEIWARRIVTMALAGQTIEDSKVELKGQWPEPERAASRLAGHANAAGGSPILWIVGVDEKAQVLTDPNPVEKSDWFARVSSFFDGYPPSLTRDVNMLIEDKAVVALYFESEHAAPYVVKYQTGGSYPEQVVPWREGTRLRTARRHELLRILILKRGLGDLTTELEFNLSAARTGGSQTIFRQAAFEKAMSESVINSLESDLKETVINAYAQIDLCNRIVDVAMKMPPLQDHYPGFSDTQAREAVKKTVPVIDAAYKALLTKSS